MSDCGPGEGGPDLTLVLSTPKSISANEKIKMRLKARAAAYLGFGSTVLHLTRFFDSFGSTFTDYITGHEEAGRALLVFADAPQPLLRRLPLRL